MNRVSIILMLTLGLSAAGCQAPGKEHDPEQIVSRTAGLSIWSQSPE